MNTLTNVTLALVGACLFHGSIASGADTAAAPAGKEIPKVYFTTDIGKPAQQILPGTIIHIPANTKHWHGAAADSWFAHLAFEIPGENRSNEWLEPVTDEEYDQLEQTTD